MLYATAMGEITSSKVITQHDTTSGKYSTTNAKKKLSLLPVCFVAGLRHYVTIHASPFTSVFNMCIHDVNVTI